MPLSNPLHIPVVLHFLQQCHPRTVLDLGIGTGSYGMLARQALDISHGRVAPDQWQANIEGVEIFEGYRNPVWDYAYNRVHMGDIRAVLPSLPTCDVTLCNDVLEHFTRDDARALVHDILQRSRVLIATTPNIDYPQGAWGGNEAETHHSQLDATDFESLVAAVETGVTTCYVCTRHPDMVAAVKRAASSCPEVTVPAAQKPALNMRRNLAALRRFLSPRK